MTAEDNVKRPGVTHPKNSGGPSALEGQYVVAPGLQHLSANLKDGPKNTKMLTQSCF